MRASVSEEVNVPVTVNDPEITAFPGMVTDPDVSIVRPAIPFAAKATVPTEGLYNPVPKLDANFSAQLARDPEEKTLFVPSSLSKGKPPIVEPS